jgi:hypothetical protein
VDVEVFLLRFRPDGTDDAVTIQSDVEVAALEFRRKSLPLFGKLSRSPSAANSRPKART